MKILTPQLIAALSQPVVPLVQLVKFDFATGTLGLNTSNMAITWDGVVYQGALGLGSISPIEDGPGEIKGLNLTLNGGPAELIALALDSADQWQGTPVSIWTAVLDSNYQLVGVELDWSGTGDVMGISEDGEKCTISATAESSAVDLLRSNVLHYSQADQYQFDATDLGFNHVVDKSDEPIVWPAKEWYYK